MTPQEKIERWFLTPVVRLEQIENGDGAFAAMSISLSLYERFVHSQLHSTGQKATPEAFEAFGASDLNVPADVFNKFWGMYRVGIQHFFQPKRFTSKGIRYGWRISADYKETPEFLSDPNEKDLIHVVINPWSFAKLVGERYRNNFNVFDELTDFLSGSLSSTIAVPANSLTPQVVRPSSGNQVPLAGFQPGPPGTGNYPV
jgi:hypothetical protein